MKEIVIYALTTQAKFHSCAHQAIASAEKLPLMKDEVQHCIDLVVLPEVHDSEWVMSSCISQGGQHYLGCDRLFRPKQACSLSDPQEIMLIDPDVPKPFEIHTKGPLCSMTKCSHKTLICQLFYGKLMNKSINNFTISCEYFNFTNINASTLENFLQTCRVRVDLSGP